MKMANNSHSSNLLFFIMMTCTALITCLSSDDQYYSIMGPNLDKLPSQDEAIQLFQIWKKEHGRVYKDLQEMANKFQTFVSNLEDIAASNANITSSPSTSQLVGLNKFSDWSFQEFEQTYLQQIPMPQDDDSTVSASSMNLGDFDSEPLPCKAPPSLDWRLKQVVTEVKSQNHCSNCWIFSATGAIEAANAIATGKLISVSEQEIMDCESANRPCKPGYVQNAFKWVLRNRGIASEIDYPYTAGNGTCKAKKIRKSVTIKGYCPVARSDQAFQCATVKHPISIYFRAVEDFKAYTSKSGIYKGPHCPVNSKVTNHVMLIVGYGSKDGEKFWIVKNSWGKGWGMDGYAWIKRGTGKRFGVCAILAHPAYSATKCSKRSDNPSISSM